MVVDKEREKELNRIWAEHRREKKKDKKREIRSKNYAAFLEREKRRAKDVKLLEYIQQVKNHLEENILDDDGTPAFWFK